MVRQIKYFGMAILTIIAMFIVVVMVDRTIMSISLCQMVSWEYLSELIDGATHFSGYLLAVWLLTGRKLVPSSWVAIAGYMQVLGWCATFAVEIATDSIPY